MAALAIIGGGVIAFFLALGVATYFAPKSTTTTKRRQK
ncbi:hypothetical protein EDF70_1011197 [Neorhizobium sp. JUb45]|jgi:hypothetical protein|nr:hypothetical protein EDF70_1011197 [Neorhizobium sp. JUb45]